LAMHGMPAGVSGAEFKRVDLLAALSQAQE
jgi:hypothetical protein